MQDSASLSTFQRLRREYKEKAGISKGAFYLPFGDRLVNNPKGFWRLVKSNNEGGKFGIPSVKINDLFIDSDRVKETYFND